MPSSQTSKKPTSKPTLKKAFVLRKVNAKLSSIIRKDLPILNKIKRFVIKSGGKRIRPLTHYYFCEMLGYQGREWQDVGAIGELIHAASLLHDDVVDGASVRRGKPAVNALYGNKTAVLSGDYLLACGIEHLRTLSSSDALLAIFTRVLRMLSTGELLQMQWERSWTLSRKNYLRILNAKTGSLFGAMTESAFVLSQPTAKWDTKMAHRYRNFGERMGRLFQIRDDYLDYFSDVQEEGKEPYQDFRRGLMTRPLMFLRDHLSMKDKRQLRMFWQDNIKRNTPKIIENLQDFLRKTNAQKSLSSEIEEEIAALMAFVREHPDSKARGIILQQLAGLQT